MVTNIETILSNFNPEKRAFINGKYTEAINKCILEKKNSYNVFDLSGIASCNENDVDITVKYAKQSFESGIWAEKSIAEKKEIVLKIANLMEQHREELAILDTVETCRCFHEYYYDSIPKAIEAVRYFAEAVDKVYDAAIPGDNKCFGVVSRIPLGVVGIITPWNDPMVVSMWKIIPALLMGNSVIVKPAEQSSLSIIRWAALAKEAGIPDGVIQVIPGLGEVAGKALALHNDVKGIFFTGSSAVGKLLLQYSGQSNMKKVGLECGGKSPYIVTEHCKNLELAAKTLAKNMFYNQGQICSAPSRVIIHNSVKDEFIEHLKKYAQDFIPDNPYKIESKVGCVVSEEQYKKIQSYIEYAKQKGYKVYQTENKNSMPVTACCVFPTIVELSDKKDKLAFEEIFGPVVVVIEYNSIEEAIEIANNTNYGLAGAVWTNDFEEAYFFARKIHSGLVHINSYGEDDNRAPFGGVNESGLGKDKSVYAFDEYSDLKTVWAKTVAEG